MANANVVFFPWVRQGAAAAIETVDTLGTGGRGAAGLDAALSINGAPPLVVPVRLRGPADVVGIDPHEIVRMDPRPGSSDFEPNYFAAIEFDRPDFPWLFTPARGDGSGRLRPWLCLVVVRAQQGVVLASSADAPLPVLEIATRELAIAELPDVTESWAWAHGQASAGADATPGELGATLGGRPERSLSRLLCPRVLTPSTDYIACVVPTFELGRRAGLGQEITEANVLSATALAPAWSPAAMPASGVRLPVYHHWRFKTGIGGDFQSLVEMLAPRTAPAGLGSRPINIGRPGFELPAGFPADATVPLGAALRPLETPPDTRWPADTQEPFQSALTTIINAPGEATLADPEADPLLAPPLYGQWHAARTTVTAGEHTWFDELNVDPRHRAVAAFGTRVVQEHQEALMAAAWAQAADLQRANQQLRQLQLGLYVTTSFHRRHLRTMSEEAVLRVGGPAFSRVRGGGDAPPTATLVARLGSASAVPYRAASPAMRRIGRERGPITRRVAAQGGARGTGGNWIAKLNTGGSVFVGLPWMDLATVHSIVQHLPPSAAIRPFPAVQQELVSTIGGRPIFTVVPAGQPVPLPPPVAAPLPTTADNPLAAAFRAAAATHLGRIDAGRLGIMVGPPPALALGEISEGLLSQIAPRHAFVKLAQAVVSSGPQATAPAPAASSRPRAASTPTVPIEPIMAAPTFKSPMYEPLRDFSQELLLPGLEQVLPNSVLGLATNRAFIEAYMVGLNVEMGRELLWRGFPTDQRGTCFARFWDASGVADPPPDITPIHEWGMSRLGETGESVGHQFVMLLRSDLLRRYPNAVIYATPAQLANGVRTPHPDPAMEVYPAFRGSMSPDVSFFGFNLSIGQVIGHGQPGRHGFSPGHFIVIQEQPTEPRFGVDVGTVMPAAHVRLADGPPPGLPANGLTWGRNAAHVAGMLRQQPVRVAIHGSKFVSRPVVPPPPPPPNE